MSITAFMIALGLALAGMMHGVLHSCNLSSNSIYVAEASESGDSVDGEGDTEYC